MSSVRSKDMENMISFCGLDCQVCPALIATRTNDDALRTKTAAEWSVQFHAEIKPVDIQCSGCTSTTGPVFHHCSVCEMRSCGQQRKLANCAGCDEYPCEKLSAMHKMVPDARTNLDAIRRSR
jgi:hypothetical protein